MANTTPSTYSKHHRAFLLGLASSALFAFSVSIAAPALADPGKNHEKTEHGEMKGMKGMEGMEGMGEHEHESPGFAFGHPAPDATPDRVIKINALDSMSYDPANVSIEAGSTVKFVVTNKGEIAHAWAIDTVEEQLEHEEGMDNVDMDKMMTHMDGEPNGFVLKPGETKSLIWTFTKGGDIQYACHLPGHYGAGMHGAVKINGDDDGAQKPAHGHEAPHKH
jgi:uncharacterized cupredoxin-like copper-binding protein